MLGERSRWNKEVHGIGEGGCGHCRIELAKLH